MNSDQIVNQSATRSTMVQVLIDQNYCFMEKPLEKMPFLDMNRDHFEFIYAMTCHPCTKIFNHFLGLGEIPEWNFWKIQDGIKWTIFRIFVKSFLILIQMHVWSEMNGHGHNIFWDFGHGHEQSHYVERGHGLGHSYVRKHRTWVRTRTWLRIRLRTCGKRTTRNECS